MGFRIYWFYYVELFLEVRAKTKSTTSIYGDSQTIYIESQILQKFRDVLSEKQGILIT